MTYPLFFSTLYLAGGLIILLMGLVILRESPRSPVNRATALMLFSGSLGTVLGALGRVLSDPAAGSGVAHASFLRNFAYLWEFFFPSLLYFALVYPRRLVAERSLHIVEAGLFVPHITHLALVLFFTETTDLGRPFEPLLARLGTGIGGDWVAALVAILQLLLTLVSSVHEQLFSFVNLGYAIVAVYLLSRARHRAVGTRVRGPLGVVLAGLTVCVASYMAAKLLPVFFPYRPSGAFESLLTSLGLFVATAAIGYAIVRYKFLDVRNIFRRSMLYGAAAVVFALVYIVVMRQVERFAGGVFGQGLPVVQAGLLVFSLIAFQPLLLGLEDLLETLLRRRDSTDPQRIVHDLARQLGTEVDLAGIRQRLASGLQQGLLVEGARLITVEADAEGWAFDDGERAGRFAPASAGGALIRFFEAAPEPAFVGELERSLEPVSETDRDSLLPWIQDYRLLVPIFQQSRLQGVLGVGPKLTGGRFHAEDIGLLGLLGQQIAVSLENLRLLSENLANRVLEEEIQLASQIQKGLLPTVFPERPGYTAGARSLASKEVGGDYFDVFCTDERRLHVAIADVSGKGVPAAILMSYLRAALRSNVQHLASPGEVLARINNLLYESTSPEKFATFFYGTLDTLRHELVYANAGHNYPILVRADGSTQELSDGGLVLGIVPNARYDDGRLSVGPGETLFLYTDGVTEATDGGDEEYGTERLGQVLVRAVREGPESIMDHVMLEVREFCRGSDLGDDITMVVVQRWAENGTGEGTHVPG